MSVNTESVFIHSIDIMVFPDIYPVAVMVGIAAPDKIMIPQIFFVSEIISKKSIGAQNGRREMNILGKKNFRLTGPGFFQNFLF